MFLRTTKQKNGRIYLAIARNDRDPITKKTIQRSVKGLGFLDELIKEYEDPIAHFKEVAIAMTKEEKENETFEFYASGNEEMSTETDDMKNIGFTALSKIYHELGIHKFLINRERGMKSKFPLNNMLKLLVYERILNPGSKLAAYENRNHYLENFNFEERALYRSFKTFAKHKETLLRDIHENVSMKYGRDTSNVFYDVTNYYFHTEEENELIKKGMSKDRKAKPIIQMGLLLDNAGLPMTYKLFSGNTTDFETLLPMLSEVKENYNLKRVIVVADKGLNSGENKAYNIIKGDGYIFSRSIRGTKANKEIKDYVLDETDYRRIGEDFKIKSRIYPTTIWVTNQEDKKVKVSIDEKHVVFYSEKYARRTQHKRQEAIAKAIALINSPSRYIKAENYGALKYIVGMSVNKETGEILRDKTANIPTLNEALIAEEQKYDGYYSIVTSELNMSDEEIVETYQGLWKIEESFKVTKSTLETRPVWVWTKDSIEAHFLSCFLSLLILRILEMKTERKYSIEKIVNSLSKANVCLLERNQYKAVYYDEILKDIDECVGTALKRKYLKLSQIKDMIAETK